MKLLGKAFMFMTTCAAAALLVFGASCAQAPASNAASAGSQASAAQTSAASEPSITSPDASYQQISGEDALALMESESDYVILDVRRPDEFASGHIPNAINLPNESIGDVPPAELPDPDQLILVYCRSGNRSKQASGKLVAMGYNNVVEFGGINTWPGELVTD